MALTDGRGGYNRSPNAKRLAVGSIVALLSVTPLALPRDYPIRAVPMTAVTIDDEFWAPKLETNRKVTIPHILEENEDTGRVANFEKAYNDRAYKQDQAPVVEQEPVLRVEQPWPGRDGGVDQREVMAWPDAAYRDTAGRVGSIASQASAPQA